MIHERAYDVFCVTRKQVTQPARNVSKGDALLTMSVVLAAYGDNWQLQPENPTGCVRVINLHTEEYHIVMVIETEISQRSHDVERVVERQQLRWLARVNEIETFHVGESIDYTINPDANTPTENLLVDELADTVESEVAYAYQI